MRPDRGRSSGPVLFSFVRLGCGEGKGPGFLVAIEQPAGSGGRLR